MALTQNLLLTVALAPLAGALIAGLAGQWVGRRGAHFFTILGVLVAFVLGRWHRFAKTGFKQRPSEEAFAQVAILLD